MANDYATRAEVQAALPDIKTWTPAYNTLLDSLITRASRAVDRKTNREPGAYFVTTDDTRYFDGPASIPVNDIADSSLSNRASGALYSFRALWIDEIADVPTAIYVT